MTQTHNPTRRWLRLESLVIASAAILAYFITLQASGRLFALLILVPDVSFAAYLLGPRAGSFAYNVAHSYLVPASLAAMSLILPALLPIALIWIAHIGLDRALGYGLKQPGSFRQTHLGTIGRESAPGGFFPFAARE